MLVIMEERDQRSTWLFVIWVAVLLASMAGANLGSGLMDKVHWQKTRTLGAIALGAHPRSTTTRASVR